MNCPYCGKKSKVSNSRPISAGMAVWRRRQCSSCVSIWTSREAYDPATTHTIVTGDSALEPLQRDRLLIMIHDSLSHRKTASDDASELTDTVLRKIYALKTAQIHYEQLLALTYDTLEAYDPTAGSVFKAKYILG